MSQESINQTPLAERLKILQKTGSASWEKDEETGIESALIPLGINADGEPDELFVYVVKDRNQQGYQRAKFTLTPEGTFDVVPGGSLHRDEQAVLQWSIF